MSSTINASTASGGGLVTSADASGILQLQTAGVTALTIDGSQNVGIGTSSPASKLDIGTGNLNFSGASQRITGDFSNITTTSVAFQSSVTNGATQLAVIANGTSTNAGINFYSNSADITNSSRGLIRIDTAGPDFKIDSQKTGTGTYLPITFHTSGSEKLRIDTSGNVGIGVTPNTNFGAKLQLGAYQGIGASYVSQNLSYYPVGGVYNWRYPLGTTGWLSGSIAVAGGSAYYFQIFGAPACAGAVDSLASISSLYYIDSSFNHVWQRSGSAESMRIDSSGNLLVGVTAPIGGLNAVGHFKNVNAGAAGIIVGNTGGTSTTNTILFTNSNGVVGGISTTGSVTAFNTSSDYRLKTNIIDAPSALASINAIKVRSFDWKVDGSHQEYGYIAQELLEVAPEAVHVPSNEDEMMGVDFGRLTPRLVKAIQELKAIIDTQNARIEALEAK